MAAEAGEWKAKGNAALSAGNHQEAVNCYTKAIELDNTQHVFFSNRSAAYLSMGQADKALEDANACIKIKPDWAKGYSRKGAALHKMQNYAEAVAAYEEGLKQDPSNAACKSGVEEVNKARSSSNPLAGAFGPDMFAKLATNPRVSHLLGDPEFVKKLQEIQQNPQKLNEHLQDQRVMTVFAELMGLNMQMPGGPQDDPTPTPPSPPKKKVPEPEPVVERELTEEEKEAKAKRDTADEAKQRGNTFYKKRDFEQAIGCYNEAIEIDPSNMSYYGNRAAVRFEMQEYDSCIEDCKKAIEVGRSHSADFALIAKVFVRIGNAYMKMGEEYYEKALDNYEMAQVENRTRDVEDKIKKIKVMIKKAKELAYIDPEKALNAKEEGNTKFKAGDFPGAVSSYSEAIKRDPSNPIYYANRAAALTKLTSFNDAKADCDKALELDPKYVKAWSRKGAIEFFMKEFHKAMESYQKGLEIDPENAECKDGYQRVIQRIQQSSQSGEVDQERAAHAMADPEIQAILQDPIMQNVLRDFQTDPMGAQRHLRDPGVMAKIEKLIAAGVLQTK